MDLSLMRWLKNLAASRVWLVAGGMAALSSCTTPTDGDQEAEAKIKEAESKMQAAAAPAADAKPSKASLVTPEEWTLLEMSYDEAKAITPQHAEIGEMYRVTATTVEVLKADDEGKPLKVKAKGHVFLEIGLPDRATALCDEAIITPKQAVLKGGPMLMQTARVAKSTSESTSFTVTDHLQVYGRFELIRPQDFMNSMMAGPNPLLPPDDELKKTALAAPVAPAIP